MRANWVFRLCLDKTKHECVPLARKLILTFILPWVFAIVLPLYGYLWGWRVGVLQAVVVTLWSLLLTEIVLLRFRKIPFTCSCPPFRDSAVALALTYVLGFFVFVMLTSSLEHWGLSNPVLMASLIAVVLVARYFLSRFREGIQEIDKELIFEEYTPASFELLDLNRGS
jgi:ABC-type amino acid transport system permease subunit